MGNILLGLWDLKPPDTIWIDCSVAKGEFIIMKDGRALEEQQICSSGTSSFKDCNETIALLLDVHEVSMYVNIQCCFHNTSQDCMFSGGSNTHMYHAQQQHTKLPLGGQQKHLKKIWNFIFSSYLRKWLFCKNDWICLRKVILLLPQLATIHQTTCGYIFLNLLCSSRMLQYQKIMQSSILGGVVHFG